MYEFLGRQQAEGEALAAASDLIKLIPLHGTPASRYVVELRCKGLVRTGGKIAMAERFAIAISFPGDYLRRVVDTTAIISWLWPVAAWHPNIAHPFICIGNRVPPGTGLVELIYLTWEIITYDKVTVREDDALNKPACAWARANGHRFPLDTRPLKRTGAAAGRGA